MGKNRRTSDTVPRRTHLLRAVAPICLSAVLASACSTSGVDVMAGLPQQPPADQMAIAPLADVPGAATQTEIAESATGLAGAETNALAPSNPTAFSGPTPNQPGTTTVADGAQTVTPGTASTVAALTAADGTQISGSTTSTTIVNTAGDPNVSQSGDAATARILAAANAPTAARPVQEASGADATQVTAPEPVAAVASPPAAEPRRGLLNGLFGNRRDPARPRAVVAAAPAPQPIIETVRTEASQPQRPVIATASASGSASGLPGFNRDRALGVNGSGESLFDDERPVVQVASAAGLARLAPNGLRTQHAGVDVKCLKPALVRVLKRIESHYRKPVIVTSGYRSPERNRRARGAKNSLHMYCAAADIQVAGVSKWDLAAFLRSVPGRGGVGTYCHTKSVHIDIGPKRDWNWRCRRRS